MSNNSIRNFTTAVFLLFMSIALLLSARSPWDAIVIASPQNVVLDSGFMATVSDGYTRVEAVAVQADGRLLIGGNFPIASGIPTALEGIARLNADGTFDSSFDPTAIPSVLDIVVQADGKIVIADLSLGVRRLNGDGSMDSTFVFGSRTGNVSDVLTLPDGKILMSGGITQYNGASVSRIARLNADGTLDTTFAPPTINSAIQEAAVQTDGKIVIVGAFTTIGGISRQRLARLNPDGSLDATFDAGNLPSMSRPSVAVQPDGKILVGGTSQGITRFTATGGADVTFVPPFQTNFSGFATVHSMIVLPNGSIIAGGAMILTEEEKYFGVVKLTSSGNLDPTFTVQENIDGGHEVFSIAVTPDNKIFAGGDLYKLGSQSTVSRRIAKINANGTIDNSFVGSAEGFATPKRIVKQADGKIIVAGGFEQANGTRRRNIVRFNENGGGDNTFAANADGDVTAVASQIDGKVVILGNFSSVNGEFTGSIARLNANGSRDTGFAFGASISGQPALSILPNSSGTDILMLENGKMLVAGRFSDFATSQARYLAMLNADGRVDTSFNSGGVGTNSFIYRIARQTDGKFIIVGNFTSYNGSPRPRIARLNGDGSVDPSFDSGTGPNSLVNDVYIQPDGKIVVVGTFTSYNGNDAKSIARLNNDGSLDLSLNVGTGAGNLVNAVAPHPDGKIWVGGVFNSINGQSTPRLALLDSDGSLSSDLSGRPNAPVTALLADGAKLYVGGLFTDFGGVPRTGLLRLAGLSTTPTPTATVTPGLTPTPTPTPAFTPTPAPTPTPAVQWTRQFGTSTFDYGEDVAVDASGNSYIAGLILDNGALPDQTSAGGGDAFLRKYDPSGTAIWTRQFGTTGLDGGWAVAVDGVGGVYIAGESDGSGFLRKYTADGQLVWVRTIYTGGSISVNDLATDASGSIFLTGETGGALPGQTLLGGGDAYIRKYGSNGDIIWTRQFGTSSFDQGLGLAVDNMGNSYVSGETSGTFPGASSFGSRDAFVMKLDPSGGTGWIKQFGTAGFDQAHAITVDSAGNTFTAGTTNGTFPGRTNFGSYDAFVQKTDTAGNLIWTNQFGSPGDDIGYVAAIDSIGSVLVAGYVTGSLPGSIGSGSGGADAFAVRYDPNGSPTWMQQFGGASTDIALSVQSDAQGGIYLAGWTFGLPGQTSSGGVDVFLRKYISAPGATPTPTPTLVPTPTSTPTQTPSPTPEATPSTPAGTNVTTNNPVGNGSITFTSVSSGGTTSFTPINPSSAGLPPSGFTVLGGNTSYDISTTAAVNPPIAVCFNVTSVNDPALFAFVRILHGESGNLVDRTILAPDPLAPNFATRTVCARVTSLSPFVAAIAPGGNSASISGSVTYGTTPAGQAVKPVPAVMLAAAGSLALNGATSAAGGYSLAGFAAGSYAVTPTKSGDVNGSISGLDAARVAQHVAGLITLTANQQIAGDTTNNGSLSGLDAARIAQTAAGISNSGIAGQWKFLPGSRSYASVAGSLTGENYEAILVGDVTGNWAPAAGGTRPGDGSGVGSESVVGSGSGLSQGERFAAGELGRLGVVEVEFLEGSAVAGGAGSGVTVPVSVGDTTGKGIVAYDFTVEYDPSVMRPAAGAIDAAGTLSEGWTVVYNETEPGRVKVTAFSTGEMAGKGVLLNLRFDLVDRSGRLSGLRLESFQLNEGEVAAREPGGRDFGAGESMWLSSGSLFRGGGWYVGGIGR
jgi:uncharacterized delta-60 repeat protein